MEPSKPEPIQRHNIPEDKLRETLSTRVKMHSNTWLLWALEYYLSRMVGGLGELQDWL